MPFLLLSSKTVKDTVPRNAFSPNVVAAALASSRRCDIEATIELLIGILDRRDARLTDLEPEPGRCDALEDILPAQARVLFRGQLAGDPADDEPEQDRCDALEDITPEAGRLLFTDRFPGDPADAEPDYCGRGGRVRPYVLKENQRPFVHGTDALGASASGSSTGQVLVIVRRVTSQPARRSVCSFFSVLRRHSISFETFVVPMPRRFVPTCVPS